MLPTVIDIEASGFGSQSYPIEIGVITPDQKTTCFLICPDDSWTHWDTKAESVHGISRDTLLKNGAPPEVVAANLNDLLIGEKVYTDAWGHDLSWLGKLYDVVGLRQLFSLDSLRYLMTETQATIWHPTKEQVISELHLDRHRASSDALILQETFKRTLQQAA